MTLENGDKATLARIDERTLGLAMQINLISEKLESLPAMFVTRDQCALRQNEHDKATSYARAESVAKVGVLISIAVSVIWAVLKHA